MWTKQQGLGGLGTYTKHDHNMTRLDNSNTWSSVLRSGPERFARRQTLVGDPERFADQVPMLILPSNTSSFGGRGIYQPFCQGP